MDELAHRFLVAAHPHGDLRRPLATGAGQHHLAATHLYAIRRAQTGFPGRALLVGERTDNDGRSPTSQDTPFRPTFTENALGWLLRCQRQAEPKRRSLPWRTLDAHLSLMLLNDGATNMQSQAESDPSATLDLDPLSAVEAFPDLL